LKAGEQGGMLAEVARQFDYPYTRIGGGELAQQGERIVARTVVDEDDFAIAA